MDDNHRAVFDSASADDSFQSASVPETAFEAHFVDKDLADLIPALADLQLDSFLSTVSRSKQRYELGLVHSSLCRIRAKSLDL